MSEENNKSQQEEPASSGRRDAIKKLVSVPVAGAMAYGVYKKAQYDRSRRNLGDMFKLDPVTPPSAKEISSDGKTIRIGIIGFGIRGKQLLRAAGFAEPTVIDTWKEAARVNSNDTRYHDYMEQESLNIVVTGVCDIFDTYADAAILSGSNINREGTNGAFGTPPKRYRYYKELLAAADIDAVIIAAPDHWHGTMAMDAALAGKHVYLEKPMSWTVPETYMIRDVVKQSGVTFQFGHQGRQTDSYLKAKQIVDKNILGPISLIEVCTNRNDPNGAWVYPIHETANERTIDWRQFEGDEERIKEYLDYMQSNGLARYVGPEARNQFDLKRFFRWRCWWDYSTGLSGDLLTHEYDAVNQILGVGIPHSATSSGGVYFFKDGRTVPDVLQTSFEFPDNDLTMLYSATLSSQRSRGKVFMGHDASMELSSSLTVKVDPRSTRYADQISRGIIKPDTPLITYIPGQENVDAVSSATELYFAQRGLLYAYVNGKRYDTTYLHIREWVECIRNGGTPSCDIDAAFEEAITAHMGTRAYLEGRTMYWDKEKEEIVRG
ncbi:MAG: Gfo/Idh/MocA family oxidoreductase [Tannerellaceae bacterium]|jgi:predicted dehydrogenase|nr:Gfo/Idh/MocA family oxidoreductase [Tannerellaceae bacterium]